MTRALLLFSLSPLLGETLPVSWDWQPISQRGVTWELGEKILWLLYNHSCGNGGGSGIDGEGALSDVATWVPAEGAVTLSLVLPLCCRWQSH